ncbi:MAG: hypothetical protein ACJ768_22730 [Gaiellaceae bacterium]
MEAARKTPRLSLTLVFVALALTAALYAITSHAGSGKPHAASPQVALAAGTLSVGNSANGSAILNATGMVPGGPHTNGSVTITNGGSLAGAFSLSKNVTGGSPLASLLHVTITQGGANVYDGSVAGMGSISLGNFAVGESRQYDFDVSFPDGGVPSGNTSGDNAGRGVTATVDYVWSASADEPAPPAGTNPGVTGSTNGTGADGGLILGSGGTSTNPSFVTLAGAGKQNPLKQHNVVIIKTKCTQACDLLAGGTLSVPNAAKAYKFSQLKKHLSSGGTATLKLKIPKSALKALKKAIAKKKSSIAKIKVTAKAGGKSSNAQRTIVLKR